MGRSTIVVSARVVAYVNGRMLGRCTGFDYSIDTPVKENRGIDSLTPYELAPMGSRITFTMSLLKTMADGGAEGIGITAPIEDIPNQKYFSVMLIERTTDTVIFQADWCMCTGQQWSVPIKDIVRGRVTAQAIEWNNETQPVHR